MRKIVLPSDELFKGKERIIERLIEWWENEVEKPEIIEFSKNKEADKLLNDIENYSHAFVLGAIMDRQIGAERAWKIPYEISKEIGSFEFDKLKILTEGEIKKIFEKKLKPYSTSKLCQILGCECEVNEGYYWWSGR